jgi:CheY-like chemotaxis protein
LPVIIFSDSAWKQQAWKEGATVVLSKSENSPSQVVDAARNVLLTSESHQIEGTLAANASYVAAKPAPVKEWQVLLVEDHYDIRATISAALGQSGLRVTGVESHAAALHQIEAREFDAYLLNRLCPDGLGLSLCNQLRSVYPQKPIVMYSTAALPITPEQRLNAGASAYLTLAGEILDPGRILLQLIEEARITSVFDSCVADELLMITS